MPLPTSSSTSATSPVLSSPAAKSFVQSQLPKEQVIDPSTGLTSDRLAQNAAPQTPPTIKGTTISDLAGGNTTGMGPGSTDKGTTYSEIGSSAAPQTAYDVAMNTYLKSLTNANDLSLQATKDQEEALSRGETSGFATGEAARVNRNNSFAIDAANNTANANLGAVNALEKRLPATPQPFNLSPGETRFDAKGNQIASVDATPKSSQIIGSAASGYYKVDPTTGTPTLLIKPTTTGGGETSQQSIDDWTQTVLNGNATMVQVPAAIRTQVAHALNTSSGPDGSGGSYSPLAASRETLAASRIASNFIALPQFQLTANGLPYLERIDAAIKTPGSVSDQDLLDSLTKLNTAGNAISDAQVKLVTDGRSLSDWAGVLGNKLGNGGVLSNNQRTQIQKIAKSIYANYAKSYQPVYDQVTAQLKAAGIPKQFWTIPDLNNLSSSIGSIGGASDTSSGAQPITAPDGSQVIIID